MSARLRSTARIGSCGLTQALATRIAAGDQPARAANAWYVARGERHIGPFPIRVLEVGLQQGVLAPSDLVWSEGLSDWIAIEQLIASAHGVHARQSGALDHAGVTAQAGTQIDAGGCAFSQVVAAGERRPSFVARLRASTSSRVAPLSPIALARGISAFTERVSRRTTGLALALRLWLHLHAVEIGTWRASSRTVGADAWARIVGLLRCVRAGLLTSTAAVQERPDATVVSDPILALRKLHFAGLASIGLLLGMVGSWAATVQLNGAVIANGLFVVESSVKRIQHPSGGVVREIAVKEGQQVAEGQTLLTLDDTLSRATLGVVRSQLEELRARETRLVTERDEVDDMASISRWEPPSDGEAFAAALLGEIKLFEARKASRQGQRAQLRERVVQIGEEIRGLLAQQEAKEGERALIDKELTGVADLYKKSLVSIARFNQLQRDSTRVEGELGQLIAEIARARARINETELQIIQLDQDSRTEILKDLRETQGRIAETKEKMAAAEDQLKRVTLRSPQAGVVHQLQVHTVGGVIGNGETIMQIVPRADELVIEAKVAPQDIDQIVPGAKVIVRVVAGNQRTIPDLAGVLTRISPDISHEPQSGSQPAQTYYSVRIALAAEELARLKHLKLVPGMTAEAFIQTHERTPLEYVLKPLQEQMSRVFRER